MRNSQKETVTHVQMEAEIRCFGEAGPILVLEDPEGTNSANIFTVIPQSKKTMNFYCLSHLAQSAVYPSKLRDCATASIKAA